MNQDKEISRNGARKQRLVVVAPGLSARVARWQPLLERLKMEPELSEAECAWLIYDPHSHTLGGRRVADMARNLVARIDEAWIRNGGFQAIILIGHSLGGMIVRAVYVTASGADPDQPQEHVWASAVRRIILLAAPNRGIEKLHNPLFRLGDWCLRLIPGLFCTYQDLQRGSVFVTNLRINWIRLFSREDPNNASLPVVVQLLGTQDRIVHREDSVDVLAFPNTAVGEVPDADHDHLPHLQKAPDPEGRYLMLKTAILNPERFIVKPVGGPTKRQTGAQNRVFILHGIRASRIDDWLRQVADEVRRVYPKGTEVIRPSYGFLSALSFTIPTVRRRYIRHFQDAYTQALARNPKADVDFIGHSNGTYMLGQSLRDISGMIFRNVVLAGSVLPPDYPWDGKLGYQVSQVRSERGRRDWPVGWLCSALNGGLWMRDVGTGGYSGFTRGLVEEELFHPGGHGSMFSPGNISRMVQFATGKDAGPPLPAQVPELAWWSLVSRLSPHIVRLAVLLFGLLVGYAIWTHQVIVLAGILLAMYLIYLILDVL